MADDRTLPVDEGLAGVQDRLDTLWTHFVGLTGPFPDRTRFLFTSPEHGSGTSTLAACTALGLARNAGDSVALIETNFFSPGIADYIGLDPTPGLTDFLDGKAQGDDVIRETQVPGLKVITAGTPRPPRRGELVAPSSRDFFMSFVPGNRYIIIDAPPIVIRPQSRFQLEFADYVVLVLRSRHTKRAGIKRALALCEEMGVPVLGAVLNRFQSDLPFGLGGKGWG